MTNNSKYYKSGSSSCVRALEATCCPIQHPLTLPTLLPSYRGLPTVQVGLADYQELAKGQMLGGADGFLKLIFHTETLKLLGVHCIGDGATEIIHIGQVT